MNIISVYVTDIKCEILPISTVKKVIWLIAKMYSCFMFMSFDIVQNLNNSSHTTHADYWSYSHIFPMNGNYCIVTVERRTTIFQNWR